MPQDKNDIASRNRQAGNQQSADRNEQSSRFDRESTAGQGASDRSSTSSAGDRSAQRDNQSRRDNQQIADDNQQSGVVDTERTGNRASNREKAEGSRENAGGISNRDLDEEQENQSRVPRRGKSKEDSDA